MFSSMKYVFINERETTHLSLSILSLRISQINKLGSTHLNKCMRGYKEGTWGNLPPPHPLQENFFNFHSKIKKKKKTSPLNPFPFSPGIHEYPLEPPRKMFWILMHGMVTLIKLVSSATCSPFLNKN